MYRIISRSRLPLTITISDRQGIENVITLPRLGSTLSARITKSIKSYQDQNIIVVKLNIPPSVTRGQGIIQPGTTSAGRRDSSSVVESMRITRSDPLPAPEVSLSQDHSVEVLDNDPSPEYDYDSMRSYLRSMTLHELKTLADDLGVSYGGNIGNETLLNRIIDTYPDKVKALLG